VAIRRGYTVEPARDKRAAMRLVVGGHGYELTIVEPNIRVAHVPSKQELADAARWSWRTRRPTTMSPRASSSCAWGSVVSSAKLA
jgi:hypothetical protein